MSATGALAQLSPRDYDAVLFDLDGVLTPTASVHAAAWKKLFDDVLRARSERTGEPFVPFDIASDYARYVDGKPRQEGVLAFLAARGMTLPLGHPEDPPGNDTVHALGHLKDTYFLRSLKEQGVQPFEGAIELTRALRAQEVKTAVVSSSRNCEAVLKAAGIADLFDTRVDGNDLQALNLAGKPAPDAFLEAARRLHVEPARAVVVEDATVGVQAGRAGGFGYVIGVDRGGRSQALREAGADVVVNVLGQIQVTVEPPSTWSLVYDGFDPAREGIRESLCALGNGYITTRGALPWANADDVHYPGTYLAGGYNRLRSEVAGRTVETEDLVNLPNCLSIGLRLGAQEWLDLRRVRILSYRQELDLRCGTLLRTLTVEDPAGRRTTLRERRFVSMSNMHLAALEVAVTAENWTGPITVRSGIDGRVINAGARLYAHFNKCHLTRLLSELVGDDGVQLEVRTTQSDLHIAQAARTRLFRNGDPVTPARRLLREQSYIGQELECSVSQGDTLVLEKLAVLHTSRDAAISEPGLACGKFLARLCTFEEEHKAHVLAWKHLWRRFDIHLRPAADFKLNIPMLLRLNMFHLLQAASLNSIGLDIGVPARGWTGEAYQGHIFWDEIFIFPTLTFRTPEIARSLLMYRYRRLDEARAAARAAGYRGAMYPWQSGSDGQEETQKVNFNSRSGRWVPDNTHLQRHVGSAIVWNVWQYFQITRDIEFLQFYGAEMILEVARFWSSIATFNAGRQRYEIHGVMGPDEFHDAYPGATTPGLRNNAYTNVMAVWVLLRAQDVLEYLPDIRRAELMTRLGITQQEIALWDHITRRMFIPFHDGIISQFEGYEQLLELDWQRYRERYGNIQRLELILEAENDSANRYKVSKQADVLMLFYLFSSEELRALFERLGYTFEYETIPRNIAYYDCRSTHGSTLSRVVHAWVLARSDRPRAMRYYAEALQSDVSDIQQGTTAEGIHLGAMAGTMDLVQRVSTGAEVTADILRLNPRLPAELERLDMRIRYRGHSLDLRFTRKTLTVRGREPGVAPIRLGVRDQVYDFTGGTTRTFEIAGD
ncbi:MAG: beta-phosphoglucomutase family hydrolase [Steroidobacteraceae bacterium]|nr:beta-phosphoglucomutase family hydrolase [Steroidobacteraceae bacterium]